MASASSVSDPSTHSISASISAANSRIRVGSTPRGSLPSSSTTQGGSSTTPTYIVPPLTRSSVSSGSRGYWQPAATSAASRSTGTAVRLMFIPTARYPGSGGANPPPRGGRAAVGGGPPQPPGPP